MTATTAVVRSVQLVGLTDRVALAVVVLANGQTETDHRLRVRCQRCWELADAISSFRRAEERPLHPLKDEEL
jgi:transcriptional regulator of heat shock response